MPTEPRDWALSSPDMWAGRRLHIRGIEEMPAGYDAEVAELFRDFRAASNLSEADLAAKLATRVEVVQALEQGALFALPPWAETCRVVSGYGMLLNLDVRPLLRRIYAQIEAGIVELRPKPVPDVPVMSPAMEPEAAMQPRAAAPQSYPNYQQPVQPAPPRRQQPVPGMGQDPGMGQVGRMQPHPPQAAPRPAAQPQPPQPQEARAAAPREPAETDKRRSGLLKWGIVALAISAMAFGVWIVLGDSGPFDALSSLSGSKSGPDKITDPDDPRSRKADRLPSAGGS